MTDLTGFRPMLSAKFKEGDVDAQLAKLDYPLLVSPKLDGIRVVCHPTLGPVTRTLKPVRNNHIRTLLSVPELHYMDGEVVVGDHEGPDYSFQRTESAVMSGHGEPEFTYQIFDYLLTPEQTFMGRYHMLSKLRDELPNFVQIVPQILCDTIESVLSAEERYLGKNYEGVMLRHQARPYKFNRSTLKQQGLIKLKRFEDGEAEIIGFEELMRNRNDATADNFGLQTRSSHKANMEPAGTLGALIVRGIGVHWPGVTFNLGSGFDAATRDLYWSVRQTLLGETVTYKYQKAGSMDAPRIPIFRGLRRDL